MSKLRELCGALEDMSVFKDTIGILDVRSRLEPAVDESESEVIALRARVAELKAALRDIADSGYDDHAFIKAREALKEKP